MGYTTDYWGEIKLSSPEIEVKLEQFEKEIGESLEEHFEIEGIELVDGGVRIGGYGKIYDDELEKFCLFIAKIDSKSSGIIECSGEEADDRWRIVVEDGEVRVEQGQVTYEEGGEPFKCNEFNKEVYKITKDKALLKELIVEELK